MDKRTKRIIASGAAALGLAAVGTAAYKNDEKLFAMGIRRSFGKNDVRRDAGLKAPEDVVRVTDLAYEAGANAGKVDPEQLLDIYLPGRRRSFQSL